MNRWSESASRVAERSITLVRDTHNLLPLRTNNVATVVVSPHGDPIELDLPRHGVESADVLVLLLALRPKSGAGAIVVPEEIAQLAKQHAHKTIAIAFGSPYVLRELGEISTFVCAWGVQPVLQDAALRAIRGELTMTGVLPVTID